MEFQENSHSTSKMQKTGRKRLQKLTCFMAFHDVEPREIWSEEPYLKIPTFATKLSQKYGYQINLDQMMQLRLLADKGENLHIESFHELGLWTNIVYEARQKKSEINKRSKQNMRPQTAKQENRKKTLEDEKTSKKEQNMSMSRKLPQLYDTITKSRLKQADEQLQKKIVENALDKKWEYLIKVGQMNAWKKQQWLTIQNPRDEKTEKRRTSKQQNKIYKVDSNDQNITIIEQNEYGQKQTLALKVFDKKYQSMKKKVTKEQKLKNNMKGTMLLVLDKKEKVSKSKLCEKISQRDHQLNYLLLEIMRLKTVFQQQNQILTECGVNM